MAWQLACRTAAMPLRTLASGRLRPGALRMDTQRLILLFIFGFSLLMLWEAWEREHRPKPPPVAQPAQQQPGVATPAKPAAAPGAPASQAVAPTVAPEAKGETIRLNTDLVVAEIDT